MSLLKNELFCLLAEKGAKLMGVADLTGIVSGDMQIGISVAVPVPKHIVYDLQTTPTKEYYDAYYSLNAQLDEIVTSGAAFLTEQGYHALANTTKVVKANEDWRTPLPHKTVATRAGLGWIGKNCLLVTPQYGSAVRISSLLTNAPLDEEEAILKSRCGGCRACVEHCPAQALKGTLWEAGMPRKEIVDAEACYQKQLEIMYERTGIRTDLCGKCFAVCTYTQKYLQSLSEE